MGDDEKSGRMMSVAGIRWVEYERTRRWESFLAISGQ